MNILITGALGNLGLMCIEEALKQEHDIIAIDIDTPKNRRRAKKLKGNVSIQFADIYLIDNMEYLLDNVDAIIHLAALLPPATELFPELSGRVNVGATEKIIETAQKLPSPPVFIYPSSVTVFGLPKRPYRVKSAYDQVLATDNYTRQKLKVENTLKQSTLPFVICRVGVSVDSRTLAADPKTLNQLLDTAADNPLEYVHPKDTAKALVNAVKVPEAQGKTLLIGGGTTCQITHHAFLKAALAAAGLQLTEEAHGDAAFYSHWMDTSEAEDLLHFQSITFADYKQEMMHKLRLVRFFIKPMSHLVSPVLLGMVRLRGKYH